MKIKLMAATFAAILSGCAWPQYVPSTNIDMATGKGKLPKDEALNNVEVDYYKSNALSGTVVRSKVKLGNSAAATNPQVLTAAGSASAAVNAPIWDAISQAFQAGKAAGMAAAGIAPVNTISNTSPVLPPVPAQ